MSGCPVFGSHEKPTDLLSLGALMHRYCYCELIKKVCFLSVMEIFSSYSSKVNITLIVLTLTDIYSRQTSAAKHINVHTHKQ